MFAGWLSTYIRRILGLRGLINLPQKNLETKTTFFHATKERLLCANLYAYCANLVPPIKLQNSSKRVPAPEKSFQIVYIEYTFGEKKFE
jgi:hypothetical protein